MIYIKFFQIFEMLKSRIIYEIGNVSSETISYDREESIMKKSAYVYQ